MQYIITLNYVFTDREKTRRQYNVKEVYLDVKFIFSLYHLCFFKFSTCLPKKKTTKQGKSILKRD